MNKHICIVDDDSFGTEILSNLLFMHGFTTQHYESAQACLKALEGMTDERPFAAFILDVVMPGMDGYELCKALRAQPKFARTPVLFVSSKNTLDDRMKGYESGGNDYLGKPVKPDELKVKLDVLLQRSPSQVEFAAAASAKQKAKPQPLAQLVHLMETSQSVQRPQTLAECLLAELAHMGLKGSVLVRSGSYPVFISDDGAEHAIERELLELSPNDNRTIEFNQRLIVGQRRVSLLLRRLPDWPPTEIDELKALLAALLQVISLRLEQLERPSAANASQAALVDLLITAEKGIEMASADAAFNRGAIDDIMDELQISLNEALLDQALDKDHEAHLKATFGKVITRAKDALRAHGDKMAMTQAPFQELITKLRTQS